MLNEVKRFLLGKGFEANRDEVARQNRLAIRYLAIAGIPLGIVNAITQTVVGGGALLESNKMWLVVYYVLLAVVERFVLPRNFKYATLLIYVLLAPVMIVSILLGTVWDPEHQAITFLLNLIIMPVFVLDRPLRLMAVTLFWDLLFICFCAAFKSPEIAQADVLHAQQACLSAVTVSIVVLRLRYDVMHSLFRTRFHLEHDQVTRTQNNRSLEGHMDRYVGRQMLVLLGDVDHFTFINDFYGHELGDEVISGFASILKDEFGEKDVYRYGGDEFLCIVLDASEDVVERYVDACRRRLADLRPEGMYTNLTCSFGYVVGTPADSREMREMIQLGDIYVHRATRQGMGRVIGGTFGREALRAGIAESSITTHAQSYEVNQLTGLPSMTYFTTRCEELLQSVADLDRHPVVGFFNLMKFRDYNDEFGFSKGDELIRFIADLLRDVLPGRHITYITGSQFGALLYLDEVENAMRDLRYQLSVYASGRPLELKAGFVEYQRGDSVISLLDKAMLAHASIEGEKGTAYRLYDKRLDDEIRFNQYLVTHVDEAIEKGWLKIYYQPIVRASDGVTCNLEALSRWIDPTYGFLSPLEFISALERENLIYKLSLHVVRQILADFERLERMGIKPVPVSVNLSRSDFFEADMFEEISTLVDASGYSRDMLSIEITESAFVDSTEVLKREVDRFREGGFAVWMDDFGSEYSTLNLLQELDFDLVKIDMQFMQNFSATGRNGIIVSDVIDMCRRLGIQTLVEGIELPEQHSILRDMGSDKLQGYLFSPPRELDALVREGFNGAESLRAGKTS